MDSNASSIAFFAPALFASSLKTRLSSICALATLTESPASGKRVVGILLNVLIAFSRLAMASVRWSNMR